MDCVIVSTLAKSCLSNQVRSFDFSLLIAVKEKFTNDKRSSRHVFSSATMRLIPLAMNDIGLRGLHFEAILKEFATSLVTEIPTRRGVLSSIVLLR